MVAHHDDERGCGDQFLWGRDILVSPVVTKGATSRRLYLPRGRWFDFWTEQGLDGGREIDREVDLATMPLHVRAGAIIPMGPVKQYTGEVVDAPITLTVYPGADGAFTMYEDDGKSFAHKRGDLMRLAMTWNEAARRFTIALAPGSRMRPPAERRFEVRLAASATSQRFTFEGKSNSRSMMTSPDTVDADDYRHR